MSVNIVEDMSSSEFYASLLGIETITSPSVAPPAHTLQRAPTNNVDTVVQDSDDEATAKKTSAFAEAFQHALSNSAHSSTTQLKLDRSNKGFRLLQKMGWNEREGGLGKNRQGNLLPVKTVLKQDKKGLGLSKKTPKITHKAAAAAPSNKKTKIRKNPNDQHQKMTKAQRKRINRRLQSQQQMKDRRIRMMLRTDISDEYEELYSKLHSSR